MSDVLTKDWDYVKQAENVMNQLKNPRGSFDLTTSKIRKILAMVSDIYNDVRFEPDPFRAEMKERLLYLKLHIVYEAGREPRAVKPFVEKAQILELLDQIGTSREKLILFCHYMEALVAYHRFLGGRDS